MNTDNLKAGDILHCRGKGWLSKAILKATKGRFSHTAIVIEQWGRIYVVGAQSNGVNPREFTEWVKKYNYDYVVSRPIFSKFDKKAMSIKVYSKVGYTKYDFMSLLIYQPIYLLFGKWLGKKDKGENKFYCSEFVAWVYDFPKWWELSPQALYELVLKDLGFQTIK